MFNRFDFVALRINLLTLFDVCISEVVLLHQSKGESDRGLGFGLRGIRMIGPLENQANLVANIARLASARINSHGRNLAFRNEFRFIDHNGGATQERNTRHIFLVLEAVIFFIPSSIASGVSSIVRSKYVMEIL